MHSKVCAIGVMALLAAGAVVGASDGLRIVPIVHEHEVLVSFDLADAYTSDVRDAIASGLRTTLTYDIELRMVVPLWVDRTIATSVVSISDQYDNLVRRHTLVRTVDGRVAEAVVADNEAVVRRWLTTLDRLRLCDTSKLDASRDYYVRIRARARPNGASLFGWASAITGQAKFTFVP